MLETVCKLLRRAGRLKRKNTFLMGKYWLGIFQGIIECKLVDG